MLLNRELKRTAAIRLRPWETADTLLYFPYGYDKGGPGFLVEAKREPALRYREWSPFNFVFVPAILTMFLVGMLLEMGILGFLLGLIEGLILGELLRRRQEVVFARLADSLPKAPVRLSEARYWQELSIQYSRWLFWLTVAFNVFLTLAVLFSLLGGLMMILKSPVLLAVHLGALAVVWVQMKRMRNLMRGRRQARALKLETGSRAGLDPA